MHVHSIGLGIYINGCLCFLEWGKYWNYGTLEKKCSWGLSHFKLWREGKIVSLLIWHSLDLIRPYIFMCKSKVAASIRTKELSQLGSYKAVTNWQFLKAEIETYICILWFCLETSNCRLQLRRLNHYMFRVQFDRPLRETLKEIGSFYIA